MPPPDFVPTPPASSAPPTLPNTPGPVILPTPTHTQTPEISPDIFAVRQTLTFLSVPADMYIVPDYLARYLQKFEKHSVRIDAPFSIMAGEITVGEFRRYVKSLDKERQQQLGARWEKASNGILFRNSRPVEYVNWQEASEYAQWLSQETGWDLRLPALEQWIAATIMYAEDHPIFKTNDDQPLTLRSQKIDHLLGNLREWSSSVCGDKRMFVLGENYLTDSNFVGPGYYCAKEQNKWTGLGFRLIRMD